VTAGLTLSVVAAVVRATPVPLTDNLKTGLKCVIAPLAAGAVESVVSNRAEVQRYYGIDQFTKIESKLSWCARPAPPSCAPADGTSCAAGIQMCLPLA
jgi:hypothetical protein